MLNLAYKLVNDRLTCEAIADALGVELRPPDLPADDDEPTTMFEVIAANLVDDVAPATTTDLARDRAEMAARLSRMLGRHARWRPTIEAVDRAEMAVLLGASVADLDDGLRQLDARIPQWGEERQLDVLT